MENQSKNIGGGAPSPTNRRKGGPSTPPPAGTPHNGGSSRGENAPVVHGIALCGRMGAGKDTIAARVEDWLLDTRQGKRLQRMIGATADGAAGVRRAFADPLKEEADTVYNLLSHDVVGTLPDSPGAIPDVDLEPKNALATAGEFMREREENRRILDAMGLPRPDDGTEAGRMMRDLYGAAREIAQEEDPGTPGPRAGARWRGADDSASGDADPTRRNEDGTMRTAGGGGRPFKAARGVVFARSKKTPGIRRFLQILGTLQRAEDPAYWTSLLVHGIRESGARYTVLTDTRYPIELEAARSMGLLPVYLSITDETQARRLEARDGRAPGSVALTHSSECSINEGTPGVAVVDANRPAREVAEDVIRLWAAHEEENALQSALERVSAVEEDEENGEER